MNSSSIEQAFDTYYQDATATSNHLEQGRLLKTIFLEPEKHSERGYILPLVTDKDKKSPLINLLKLLILQILFALLAG
jgi:hypothetical protein